jgi:hypothetical protein
MALVKISKMVSRETTLTPQNNQNQSLLLVALGP